jgi:hypothetical protein
MAKLRCECGYLIVDQADNLAYKGRILRDQVADRFFDRTANDIAMFVEAILKGKRQDWLVDHFTDVYPADTDTAGVIHDIIAGYFILKESIMIYQCEQCGRIWIQEQARSNNFRSFVPDSAWKGTLAITD